MLFRSVGSAVGFLRAPVAFELARSLRQRDDGFSFASINKLLQEMKEQATSIVAAGALGAKLITHRSVEMRYEGQGHEISVPLPGGSLNAKHAVKLRAEFEARYEQQFGLRISDVPVEFLTWSVSVSSVSRSSKRSFSVGKEKKAAASGKRGVFDTASGNRKSIPFYPRKDLAPGMKFAGPALVVEPQTTTLVPRGWRCSVAVGGDLILESLE